MTKPTRSGGPHGRRTNEDAILKHLPPDLRREIEALRKYEGRVLEALQDEEMTRLFTKDPAEALGRMKIPLSPRLRKRLREHAKTPPAFVCPPSFLLPNGRKLTPRVRVHFTGAKED